MNGSVSTSLIHWIHDFVESRGLDSLQVLGEPRPADETGLSHVPLDRWFMLLDRTMLAFSDPLVGLSIAASVQPKHGGLLAYLTQSCATVGEALLQLHKFERLLFEINPGHYSFDLMSITMKWGVENGLPNRLSDECLMAGLVAYLRRITDWSGLSPVEVRFLSPEPDDRRPYEVFFGCPVHFGSPCSIVRLPLIVLARRLVHHDTTLRDLLEQQARTLLQRLPPQDSFQNDLQAAVAGMLPNGKASVATCAKRLNVSARTLQRQLSARGTTFQSVLDQTRERLCEAYLSDASLKLADVAFMLGYVDQTAFTRAFTRWKGDSPARWRKAQADRG